MYFSQSIVPVILFCCCPNAVSGFQPPLASTKSKASTIDPPSTLQSTIASLSVAAALIFAPADAALAASPTAAQISLNSIPPTSIRVEIQDLPVIGSLLSGTYTKIDDTASSKTSNTKESVVIRSPSDKVKAIAAAATAGHLEFDISGKLVGNQHVDVDIAADQAGTAQVTIQSPLIPRLPFSQKDKQQPKKESAWNVVTNLGSGESYYFNAKTGVTQLDRPQL